MFDQLVQYMVTQHYYTLLNELILISTSKFGVRRLGWVRSNILLLLYNNIGMNNNNNTNTNNTKRIIKFNF
jgi:hypothetical protein